jgi:hypothetical protein
MEYKIEIVDMQPEAATKHLNRLAAEGWRLVLSHVQMVAKEGPIVNDGGPAVKGILYCVMERSKP